MRTTLGNYKPVLDTNANLTTDNLQTATTAITNQITASEATTSVDTFNVLSAFAALGESFADVSPFMTLLTNSMVFASNFLPHAAPQTLVPTVETTAANLATELGTAYSNAGWQLDKTGDYIAADPVKLQTIGNEVVTGLYSMVGDREDRCHGDPAHREPDPLGRAARHRLRLVVGARHTGQGHAPQEPGVQRLAPVRQRQRQRLLGPGSDHPAQRPVLDRPRGGQRSPLLPDQPLQPGLGDITDSLFKPINAKRRRPASAW